MKTQTIKPAKCVRRLKPYNVTSHKVWGHSVEPKLNSDTILKLDWNETTNVPNFIFEKIVHEIANKKIRLNWYPNVHNSMLLRKLSEYVQLPQKNIQYFNGSDGALEYIPRVYIEPGQKVVLLSPTYDNFRVYAESCSAKVVHYFNNSAFEKNINKLISFLNYTKPKLVYIANPNNPTGLLYQKEEVRDLLEKFPNTLFILDEAYYEFCQTTCSKLVKEFSNIIITRTFTKSFGLGAFRLGYVLACESIIENLNKIRVGKNINSFAQIAGIISLENKQYMEQYVEQVNQSKIILIDQLTSLGLEAKNTPLNFILVKCKKPACVVKLLEKSYIFVRNRSNLPQLEGYIRITVGDTVTMGKFFDRFKTIFENNKSCFF